MLRTNLATRPFYNERAVRLGIAAGIVAVAALTAFNAARDSDAVAAQRELTTRASTAEARARSLREQASALRKTVDQRGYRGVQAAAREANLLIERRAFSWTDLFNRSRRRCQPTSASPPCSRRWTIRPHAGRGDGDLEARRRPRRVHRTAGTARARSERLSRQEVSEEDGALRSVIQGYYGPDTAVPASLPRRQTLPRSNGTTACPHAHAAAGPAGAPVAGSGPMRPLFGAGTAVNLSRVMREHRAALVPLVIVLAINARCARARRLSAVAARGGQPVARGWR